MTNLFSVDETGVITIDAGVMREQFEQAYKTALNAPELNTDSGTPQGNLIDFDMSVSMLMQEELLKLANSFLPFYATGDELDQIGAVFGYTRKLAQPTIVVCSLSGVEGTIIPAGSLVSDGSYQYSLLDTITLGSLPLNAQFACTTGGAISVQPNTINTIITPVSGWDSVSNPYAGVTGYATETDNEFRQRMTANWLNIRGKAMLGSIIDNIAQLNGVMSVAGRENPTNSSLTIDGLTLDPHSICICVLGGDSQQIAKVLYNTKTLGCYTSDGGQTSTVANYYDPTVDYTFSYNIVRAQPHPVSVQVLYADNPQTPSDILDKINGQINLWISQNPFKPGEPISGSILSQAFVGFPYADILSLEVGDGETPSSYSNYIQVPLYEYITVSNISVEEV